MQIKKSQQKKSRKDADITRNPDEWPEPLYISWWMVWHLGLRRSRMLYQQLPMLFKASCRHSSIHNGCLQEERYCLYPVYVETGPWTKPSFLQMLVKNARMSGGSWPSLSNISVCGGVELRGAQLLSTLGFVTHEYVSLDQWWRIF